MSKDLVWVYSVPNHLQLKEYILSSIDQYDQVGECPDPVTKTDFYDYTFESGFPDYFPHLADSLDDLFCSIGHQLWMYPKFGFNNIPLMTFMVGTFMVNLAFHYLIC